LPGQQWRSARDKPLKRAAGKDGGRLIRQQLFALKPVVKLYVVASTNRTQPAGKVSEVERHRHTLVL
jgi:hypothetical protein